MVARERLIGVVFAAISRRYCGPSRSALLSYHDQPRSVCGLNVPSLVWIMWGNHPWKGSSK